MNKQNWTDHGFSGDWIPLKGGAIDVSEPATGSVMATVGLANADDISRAAGAAATAQKDWADMAFLDRADVFRRAAAIVGERMDELAGWIVRETGAIMPKAMFEITSVIKHMHEAAAMLTQPRGLLLPMDGTALSMVRRVPHGVVGIISPFNFPFLLTGRSLYPALATGNGVVLKPDQRTPISGGFLHAEILEAAGLPKGLLQVMPGAAEAGEALISDPMVQMISFTGSTAVGRRVGELAGRHLKKVALELGGKNALIICDDADMDAAVANGAWASWLHQGQICMSAGKHLVHEKVAEEYIARMAEKAKALPVGDPSTGQVALGPLISDAAAEKVSRIVDSSVAMGARVHAGGKADGRFFPATVIDGVNPQMPLFREEIFGPVVSITTFSSDEEAISLANDTEYGLSAGILTADIGRGKKIAEQLRVGLVHVNDQTVADDGFMPMGGFGNSGNGSRHGGPANWDEFTQWQWMTIRDEAPMYPL